MSILPLFDKYTPRFRLILLQGYEYFGYDPATYFSSDADENSFGQDHSFINEDGHGPMAITDESQEGRESRGERQEQPVLEIDLDQVEDGCGGKNVGRSEQNQILRSEAVIWGAFWLAFDSESWAEFLSLVVNLSDYLGRVSLFCLEISGDNLVICFVSLNWSPQQR